MNKYINSEASQHVMKLLLLGANVQLVSGKMVYVKFSLENGIEVAYVYHINKKNNYFLERISPYPLPIREFSSPEEVIDIIQLDYEQYKNAAKSANIKEFVNLNKEMHTIMKSFEDLFLYYNVSADALNTIKKSVYDAKEAIRKASADHDRVFFDKEPDNL